MTGPQVFLDVDGDDGFALTFPYDPMLVKAVKQQIPGVTWDAKKRAWISNGPEILLDLQRFGYAVFPSPVAWQRADKFMHQVHTILDVRDRVIDEPFGYQKVGTRVMLEQKRGILADTMGLGKTKQSIDALVELWPVKVLVLAPKSLIYNWQPEFAKWSDLPAVVVPDEKAKRQKFWAEQPQNGAVVIANYEKIRSDDWPAIQWDVVIADEATALKNYQTQLSKAFVKLIAGVSYVWLLSGTPLEIRAQELYQLMRTIRPTVFGGFSRFREEHLETDWNGNVIGTKNRTLLSERIAPFVLRRTKEDVNLQIPPKLHNEVWVEMTAEERRTYNRMYNEFAAWLKDEGRDSSEMNKLTQLLRLQQFTSSPDLVKGEDEETVWGGSKYASLKELVDGWDGRVLVFTRFAEMAYRLIEWMGLPKDALIAGEVKAEDRVERINRFNAGALGQVLISTDAGAFGLNVTGADMIVHYDLLWNPAKLAQREDRLHRIGQTKTVNVVNLMVQDSIDAGMYYVVQERAQLFKEIMDGAESAIIKAIDLRKAAKGQAQRKAELAIA